MSWKPSTTESYPISFCNFWLCDILYNLKKKIKIKTKLLEVWGSRMTSLRTAWTIWWDSASKQKWINKWRVSGMCGKTLQLNHRTQILHQLAELVLQVPRLSPLTFFTTSLPHSLPPMCFFTFGHVGLAIMLWSVSFLWKIFPGETESDCLSKFQICHFTSCVTMVRGMVVNTFSPNTQKAEDLWVQGYLGLLIKSQNYTKKHWGQVFPVSNSSGEG